MFGLSSTVFLMSSIFLVLIVGTAIAVRNVMNDRT